MNRPLTSDLPLMELRLSEAHNNKDNIRLNITTAEHAAIEQSGKRNAGFEHCGIWLRQFNFISMLAIK